MGTIKIYIKLVDDKLDYRDSESHKGRTIETSVDPGDIIVWKLDQCSGLKEITGISVSGAAGFFSKGPTMKDYDRWKAKVSDKATGEVSYTIGYEKCTDGASTLSARSAAAPVGLRDQEPPKLKVKG